MSATSFMQLVLIAIFVGSVPLAISFYRGNTLSLNRLSVLLLFLTFDLILFGAYTRLSDSGLGCPDWPGCYGHSNPLNAAEHIALAQTQMPDGPVTHSKAWIEMLHRYFASGIGFLILITTVIAFLKKSQLPAKVFPMTLALFILVCVQGAFGALTVTLKLQPIIVTIHLLLAIFLFMGILALKNYSSSQFLKLLKDQSYSSSLALALMIVCGVQVILGAWVSTNYAVLACQDFPSCNGALIPAMDFKNGFTLWRELGKTISGEYLPIEALIAIHWTHRFFAGIVLIAILFFYFKNAAIARSGNTLWHLNLKHWLKVLLLIVFLQVITGLSNVVLHWPLIAALMHTGGAALLMMTVLQLYMLSIPKTLLVKR